MLKIVLQNSLKLMWIRFITENLISLIASTTAEQIKSSHFTAKQKKTDKTTVSRIVSKFFLLLNNRHTTTILQMVISVFLDWFILNFSKYPLKEKKEIVKPFITWLQNKDVAKSYICNCCSKIEWYIPFQMVYVVDLKKGVKVRLEVGK